MHYPKICNKKMPRNSSRHFYGWGELNLIVKVTKPNIEPTNIGGQTEWQLYHFRRYGGNTPYPNSSL